MYGEALAAAGIRSVHAGESNLLETREAKDGLAFLRFLADPCDYLALVTPLRSPFFALDDRHIYKLAQKRGRETSWWEQVRDSKCSQLIPVREVLEKLLSQRCVEPLTALLRLADRLTGYIAVMANLPGAEPGRLTGVALGSWFARIGLSL